MPWEEVSDREQEAVAISDPSLYSRKETPKLKDLASPFPPSTWGGRVHNFELQRKQEYTHGDPAATAKMTEWNIGVRQAQG